MSGKAAAAAAFPVLLHTVAANRNTFGRAGSGKLPHNLETVAIEETKIADQKVHRIAMQQFDGFAR